MKRKLALLAAGTVVAVLALGVPVASAAGGTTTVIRNGQAIVVHPHGRFGVVPQRGVPKAVTAANLRYGGGIDGIGVTTGPPKAYIVYWGTQWGTSSVNGSGYTTFSNDSAGYAPDQQAFFKGLGTNNELWSGVPTQYCQGVASGATSCPQTNTQHVGYPTGGALAGVWYDNSAAAPSAASQAQIAAEAVAAAAHFGNTTSAANRNVQYIVTSAKGTNPDHYKTGGFCAWHDYTTSSYGDLAYTNAPYLLDVGTSCGQNFVNSGSAGTLDGVTIVGGHEFSETISDQNPAGGWTDSSGAENADKCAWISSGQGASQNITLATGTFAVQSTWANDFNGGAGGCEVSHAVVGNGGGGGNDFSISASPSSVTVTQGQGGSSTISTAVTSGSAQTVSLSASGLPSGGSASFNPSSIQSGQSSTLTLSTTASTPVGTYSVTVTGTGASATHSTSVSLTVNSSGGGGGNVLLNPGFESGSANWTASSGVIGQWGSSGEPPHGGTWDAWMDGYGSSHTDSVYQQVSIPSSSAGSLTFWLHIDTAETTTSTAYDTLKVQVRNTSGTVLATLATYSNLNKASGYSQKSLSVAAYRGQTVRIYLLGVEDSSLQTSFVVDDFSLT